MRRIGIPIVIAIATALFAGPVTPATARTPLAVLVACSNNGGYTFACYAYPSGGTGSYSSYSWTVTIRPAMSLQTHTYNVVTYDSSLYGNCSAGDRISVAVTVTDSGGATDSASFRTVTCSQWAD